MNHRYTDGNKEPLALLDGSTHQITVKMNRHNVLSKLGSKKSLPDQVPSIITQNYNRSATELVERPITVDKGKQRLHPTAQQKQEYDPYDLTVGPPNTDIFSTIQPPQKKEFNPH